MKPGGRSPPVRHSVAVAAAASAATATASTAAVTASAATAPAVAAAVAPPAAAEAAPVATAATAAAALVALARGQERLARQLHPALVVDRDHLHLHLVAHLHHVLGPLHEPDVEFRHVAQPVAPGHQ